MVARTTNRNLFVLVIGVGLALSQVSEVASGDVWVAQASLNLRRSRLRGAGVDPVGNIYAVGGRVSWFLTVAKENAI